MIEIDILKTMCYHTGNAEGKVFLLEKAVRGGFRKVQFLRRKLL